MTGRIPNETNINSEKYFWYPFLIYIENCEKEGKEPTVNEWLSINKKLEHQKIYDELKAQSIEKKTILDKTNSNNNSDLDNEEKASKASNIKINK